MKTPSLHVVLIATAFTVAAPPAPAQEAGPPTVGRLVGRVIDEASGVPIPGAYVGIAAGGVRTVSGPDGRYTLLNLPAGPTAITVRAIGYSPKTVSGIVVPPGGVAGQDVALAPQGVQVAEITVTAATERGSVAAALDEQRYSTAIVNAVTAEEIARSPDGDAGQAVQRVSGVTVQDGRYVLVRGLGERYTTTTLDNARLPSPEPDRKVVPLDLFPSSLLEAVQTSKTFTPEQPGDFSGAQVNLRTREFIAGRHLSWSFGAGVTTAATFRDLPVAPRVGSEWAGFPGREREIPASVDAAGNLSGVPQSEIPGLIGAFRNVWSAGRATPEPNGSLSFTLGGEDPVAGHLIGYLGSFTYSSSTEVRQDEERARTSVDPVSGATQPLNAYSGLTVSSSVLWGGILNLTTRFGTGSKLSFRNTYNRSGDNSVVRAAGVNEELSALLDITRLDYVARSVRSSQLAGEHLVAGRHLVTWAATSAGVTRDQPDRSDVAYYATRDSATGVVSPVYWFEGQRSGVRTFGDLSESSWQGDLALRLSLGSLSMLKVGGQYRATSRHADTRSYDIGNFSMPDSLLRRRPEEVFGDSNDLTMLATTFGGRYDAADRLWAGFVQAELALGARLRVIAGARVEHSAVRVSTTSVAGALSLADPVTTDVLPAVAVTWQLSRSQQLRLSATQTLSRQEYREMAEVCYFEILGHGSTCGNPDLERALIQNADARWEFYPSGGEIISFGLFAKHFTRPIERILTGSTNDELSYFVNSDGAVNYGVEIEVRKSLGALSSGMVPFSVFANATLMRSRITTGNDSISALTNNERPMAGQSPYVVNAGLTYTSASGRFSGTLLYNVTGQRIIEVGVLPRPDTYEEARHLVDLALRFQVGPRVSLKLDARNLLDAPYRVTQGTVVRHRYTVGRGFALGIGWEP